MNGPRNKTDKTVQLTSIYLLEFPTNGKLDSVSWLLLAGTKEDCIPSLTIELQLLGK